MADAVAATILLAEDDDGHAMLVQRNLRRAGILNEIVRTVDGQEALDYVQSKGIYAGKPRPTPLVMLFDINMPRMDGIQALAHIKGDPHTRSIPIVMLTTTDDPREIERCYQAGCSLYITKPIDYEQFCDVIQRLGLFLQIVQIPRGQ
ncbi:MAG TPA: response regulator [Gammaproteobacteria bacterium]|jgi:CheY-like chemotaxis protein|nr:response regulator [Gammaproteobacteria bacterium]